MARQVDPQEIISLEDWGRIRRADHAGFKAR
jgi:hypothetical protein